MISPRNNKIEKAAVVIVIYREEMDPYEEISFTQCLRVLSGHPIIIVKPASVDIKGWSYLNETIKIENFPDFHFKNVGAYSRLLLSPTFYKRFVEYEYILIYQLDAFVFKDDLHYWCDKDLDYLGAPWFTDFDPTEQKGEFMGVGNGGFSLRKVASHLKVLRSFSYVTSIKENLNRRFRNRRLGENFFKLAGGLLLDYTFRNNTHWLFNSFAGHEDQFWGLFVPMRLKWFKMPTYEQASEFSFEMQPRRLYELTNRELPFGCHAWWKYDLSFWTPHIESFGYKLPQLI